MMRRVVIFILALLPLMASAQFNVDRLIMSGRSALYYEDYVLAIQHFNRAIDSKPYLYEPWFYRGVAKFYLDDFAGAEKDCGEAIALNPYVSGIYELRGLCRIRLKKFEGAISDYDRALKDNPSAQNYWFNRMLCRLELKDYDQVHLDLDTIIGKWSKFSRAYSVKAGVYLMQKDTTQAAAWLDKALELDPYDVDMWMTRASISLSKGNWKEADEHLTRVIHLKPKMVHNYLNRAIARLNINNLRSNSIPTISSPTITADCSGCRWATTTGPSPTSTMSYAWSPTMSWPSTTGPCSCTRSVTCVGPFATTPGLSSSILISGSGCRTGPSATGGWA